MHASRNLAVIVLVVVGGLTLAGCGSSSDSGSPGSTTPTSAAGGEHVARPVSSKPSTSAKMICGEDVREDTYDLLGVQITQPLKPTWVDHVYSCKYVYPNGSMTLSVKELADTAETDAYFASLATKLHKVKDVPSLGEGAFKTQNESAVVRKDYKVLTVDVSGLPPEFGNPPNPRDNVALSVAATIMGCWTGE